MKAFPISMCCVCPCHKRGFGENVSNYYCFHSVFSGAFGAVPKIKVTSGQLHIKDEFTILEICPLDDLPESAQLLQDKEKP